MDRFSLFRNIQRDTGGKMALVVLDGLGGLPKTPRGKTELESERNNG